MNNNINNNINLNQNFVNQSAPIAQMHTVCQENNSFFSFIQLMFKEIGSKFTTLNSEPVPIAYVANESETIANDLKKWVDGHDHPEYLNPSREILQNAAESILAAFDNKKVFLSLNNIELLTLPSEIGCLVNLQKLQIETSNIITLPSEIGSLLNLRGLIINFTWLTILPPEIRSLKNLHELDLSSNKISALPPEIGSFTILQELSISKNKLFSLPSEIGSLVQLRELKLNSNLLTILPPEIGRLQNLLELYISDNYLPSLPAEIGNLVNLLKLNISQNLLITLPTEIGKLSKLQMLCLDNNKLIALPPEIGRLSKLQMFSLDNNELTVLPPEIGRLSRLKELRLGNNLLTTLPPEIGSLSYLEKLVISYNRLTTFPSEIGNLAKLQSFIFVHNPNLCSFPMTLGNCLNLTFLNLDGVGVDLPEGAAAVTIERDAILARTEAIRRSKGVLTLPNRLATWKVYGKVNVDFSYLWNVQNFTHKQQLDINEWLVRLERCEDFKYKREKLAKLVCKILVTLKNSIEFRKAFFGKLEGNLVCCDDRASMLLNTIYIDLVLLTFNSITSDKKKLEILIRLSKTLTLRETLEKMILRYESKTKTKLLEDVEIYLYHEIKHKEKLNLLTAIDNMHYSEMGRAPNVVDEVELLETVEKKYLDTLINLDALDKVLGNYPAYLAEKYFIGFKIEKKHGIIEERKWEKEEEYINAIQAIQEEKENSLRALKKKFIDDILHVGIFKRQTKRT